MSLFLKWLYIHVSFLRELLYYILLHFIITIPAENKTVSYLVNCTPHVLWPLFWPNFWWFWMEHKHILISLHEVKHVDYFLFSSSFLQERMNISNHLHKLCYPYKMSFSHDGISLCSTCKLRWLQDKGESSKYLHNSVICNTNGIWKII